MSYARNIGVPNFSDDAYRSPIPGKMKNPSRQAASREDYIEWGARGNPKWWFGGDQGAFNGFTDAYLCHRDRSNLLLFDLHVSQIKKVFLVDDGWMRNWPDENGR